MNAIHLGILLTLPFTCTLVGCESDILRTLRELLQIEKNEYTSNKERFIPEDREANLRLISRKLFECANEGGQCGVLNHCCGDLHCYRKHGFTLDFAHGSCVTCFNETQVCQKNKQCCNLENVKDKDKVICDKKEWNDINGLCHHKRKAGTCWEDEQCVNDCKKEDLSPYGFCR